MGSLALAGVHLPAQAAGHKQFPSSCLLRRTVLRLGSSSEKSYASVVADVRTLAERPAISAGLLVSQLHVLKHPGRTIVGDVPSSIAHVLWCIRALRYITGGLDFRAPTRFRFGASYDQQARDYWLHYDGPATPAGTLRTGPTGSLIARNHFSPCAPVSFFSVWESRGRTYIAPVDAQNAIIDKWRQWYAKEGKSYKYTPLKNSETWQWID